MKTAYLMLSTNIGTLWTNKGVSDIDNRIDEPDENYFLLREKQTNNGLTTAKSTIM